MDEQQQRCIECRWCCEYEATTLRNANDRTLHVGWLKGMRQVWVPWSKQWIGIFNQTKCKHISKSGCAIYDSDTKPYICSEWMCPVPKLTYAKVIPILERASQRILNRKFKNWKRSGERNVMELSKRLIIGCGSGRCGTSSLAALLNTQLDSCITHENCLPLPWYSVDRPYIMSREIIKQYPHRVVGDVAFWWLRYVRDIIKDFPNARIVCLRRDKEATIKSMIKCSKKFDSNHYTDDYSEHYDHTKWPLEGPDSVLLRSCFPKYDAPLAEAAGHYWDEYYHIARQYEKILPRNFKIFDTENLNSHQGVVDILRFCGFDTPVVINYNLQKEVTV